VRPTVLHGEFDLTIDIKHRLSIPSEVRRALDVERDGEAFFVVVGPNRRVWLYPERTYENMVSQSTSELAPNEYLLLFDQLNFALASRIEWDKQGRILLPEKTLGRTGLRKEQEITMVGSRDHLELWDRAQWTAHSDDLLARRGEITMRAKQASPPAT
jgi:MraZ protein